MSMILFGGKVSEDECVCCVKDYLLCIVNGNAAPDNGWDAYINGNFIANYDGSSNFNQCFDIKSKFLKKSGENNTIDFNLVVCQTDDRFEFYIKDKDENTIYDGSSDYLNGSFFENGTCQDTSFSRTFTLPN